MAVFVLVHGSFHGGWAWRDVARGLRAAGHDVFTPTLTGLGERVHLLSERPTQQLHAEDVCNLLFYEDLQDVVLVGHSYGGIVITLAAERTDRIGHLVYLDAMIPRHGKSLLDLVPQGARDYLTHPSPGPVHTFPPMESITDGLPEWARDRLTDQPATDLTEPLLLPTDAAARLPRTFVAAAGAAVVDAFAPEVRRPPWRYLEYDGDHEALLKAPGVVTAALLEAQASRPRVG